MNVRQAAWTRDGSRLALLTTAENGEQLPATTAWIWDATSQTLTEVPQRPGSGIALTSELTWSPDGSKLVVATRDPAERSRRTVCIQTLDRWSNRRPHVEDAFLDWDALRRGDRLRSLVELDPRTGEVQALLAPLKLTDYQVSRDGSFITFREDATEKTDYDVISGTNNHLKIAHCRNDKDAPRRENAEDGQSTLV